MQSIDWRKVIGAVLALIVAAGLTVSIVDNGPDREPGTPRRAITVTLGGPGHAKVQLDQQDQAQLQEQRAEDAHDQDAAAESDLQERIAPGPQVLADVRKIVPDQKPFPATLPLATVHTPGCTTALVRNFSARPPGARVALFVIHWTGSAFGTGPAIVRWFDDARAQASSQYIVDIGGRCWLTVAEAAKAWTQAWYNGIANSVEIVNPGVQPLFHDAAQRRRVVQLMHRQHRVYGLPYQHARVTLSGAVARPGFLAHRDLGALGGGHPDVGTFDLDGLIREAKRTDPRLALQRRRREHTALHARLRDLCTKPGAERHPAACATLRKRNTQLHRQGI